MLSYVASNVASQCPCVPANLQRSGEVRSKNLQLHTIDNTQCSMHPNTAAHATMTGRRDDKWCTGGKNTPETSLPGAVAQLSASGKFTSNQRIDDGNLRIVGPSSRRNSSIPEPRTTYPHHSPGSPIQLSPVDKYKTSRRRNTNKRPSTTSAGNMRHRKSATSSPGSLQIRPSTRARAEWRMEIDDPLHVNKRLKTGAVHFETHLSTVESVTLFDSNGGETKKLQTCSSTRVGIDPLDMVA